MTDPRLLLADAAARAAAHLAGLDDRAVFPPPEAVAALAELDVALPTVGRDPHDVLAELDRLGGPATVASPGGRYFGFVTGGAHPVGVGAAWLASAWDQNAAMAAMSPVAAALDRVAGRWITELLGLPVGATPTFTAGTSSANATAMAVARDRLLTEAGHDVVADGLFGAPPLRVVVGDAHSSVTKALGLLGLGRDRVVRVPTDRQGRIVADELPAPGEPTLIVTQAGNVNTGSSDPFDRIADHFAGSPHWIHVDGAFGLWAAAAPERQVLVAGVQRAHSWATDLHKWLNVTYDSAVAIVRDAQDLTRTFTVGAAYLANEATLDPVHRGLDMSQRARAVETWAVLAHLGRDGVADLVERSCRHAGRLADELGSAGFTIHNEVVLNQVLVSLEEDGATDALLVAIPGDGTLWAGGSIWHGRRVIRLSVSGWATTDDDITRSIAALRRLAGR
ncbi:MAG: pyridoxal-dependent decarboxylase [Actinomycetota bacterium]